MLKIKVNNVVVYTKAKLSILEVCQTIGIKIPRFCYHEKLSVAGNCRMCLVEVENFPKPVVSCSMPVMNDMKIFTDTPLVKKARENILELLLLNHPLDCPICDQGGECDLQDQALLYGSDISRFYEYKRGVSDKNLSPVIKTIMTRCIHCTRCVRFAQEVAGVEDLGTLLRGTDTEIGTYVEKLFKSEISGNVIDLCPVGALTSKAYSFVARSWELKSYESIDCSDSLGSNIKIDIKNNKIVRVLPKYSEINDNWISDKTRFLFDGNSSSQRTSYEPSAEFCSSKNSSSNKAKIKWSLIFKEIINSMYILNHFYNFSNKNGNLVIVVGDNVDLETLLILEQLNKEFEFIKIRRESASYLNSDFEYDFTTKITNRVLNNSTFCCLIGVNTRYESSVLNVKLRKRYLMGDFSVTQIGSYNNLTFLSQSIGLNIYNVISLVSGTSKLCQQLILSKNPIIIIGSGVFKHKNSSKLLKILKHLEDKVSLSYLNAYSNETGSGFLTQTKHITLSDFKKSKAFYFVENNFEEKTFDNLKTLNSAGLFNKLSTASDVSYTFTQNTHQNSDFTNSINKILNSEFIINYQLPVATFYEKNSTFINNYGMIQKTSKVLQPIVNFKESCQIFQKIIQNNYFYSFMVNSVFNNYSVVSEKFKFKRFFSFFSPLIDFKNNKNKTVPLFYYKQFPISKTKMYNSKLTTSIDNFYVGGNDLLSRHSKIMKKCSKISRNSFTNFDN